MYLQPYNNPRAGLFSLQRKLHSSTLNLATGAELRASRSASISEENSPQMEPAGPSRGVPGRLHKARSLDVLSETRSQTQIEGDPSTSDGRTRSMSNTSSERSFSSLSSDSESTSSLKEEARPNVGGSGRSTPADSLPERRSSSASSESSGSITSKGSETASNAPRVPPRPKTEEILNRCTTMTRKAALATKTRLQAQPESVHSR